MPKYIIETTARASIREFWSVEADGETDARNMLDDGDCELLAEEVFGDEENRQVVCVHAPSALATHMAEARARNEAAAMLAALRKVERVLCGFEGDDSQDETIDDDLAEIRSIIARVDRADS